jgi:hypothetical protein
LQVGATSCGGSVGSIVATVPFLKSSFDFSSCREVGSIPFPRPATALWELAGMAERVTDQVRHLNYSNGSTQRQMFVQ